MKSPTSLTIAGADSGALNVLAWRRRTSTAATPCLLLHGFGHHGHVWQPLAQRLTATRPVYAPDLRGHGDSAADPQARYGLESLVADLLHCVDTLGLPALHLAGHSLGARIALLFAARYPRIVETLTIVDSGPEVGAAGAARLRADSRSTPACFESPDAYLTWLKRRHLLAKAPHLRRLARYNLRRGSDGWHTVTDPAFADALWCADKHDDSAMAALLWQALRAVRCPTLVVRGQISSILAASTARSMATDALANGTLLTVPHAGHAVMLDNPECFSDGYCDWLACVTGAAGAEPSVRTSTA